MITPFCPQSLGGSLRENKHVLQSNENHQVKGPSCHASYTAVLWTSIFILGVKL